MQRPSGPCSANDCYVPPNPGNNDEDTSLEGPYQSSGPFKLDPSGGGGVGGASPNDDTPGSQVSSACQAQPQNMLNAEHGTSLTNANITDFYNNGTAANLIIDASELTAAQFNSFQPGRYSTYGGQFLLGFGMAGHIANEPGVNAGAVFSNSNIGGNLSVHFAFLDDHGYANNPIGALIHCLKASTSLIYLSPSNAGGRYQLSTPLLRREAFSLALLNGSQ